MKIRKTLAVLALSLAFTACGNDKADSETKTDDTISPVSSTDEIRIDDISISEQAGSNEQIDAENEDKLSLKEVVAKAKEEYMDYSLESISYDKEDGEYYKVKLFMDKNEVSLYMDPMTGQVIKKEEDMDDDMMTALDEKYLDNTQEYLDQALEDADVYGKAHYIEEWSLEMEDGRPLLEAEIYEKDSRKKSYTYKIDPETGKVLEKEIDD